METYEMFTLPQDHWTWVAIRELPWPHSGVGYVGCCGRCGSLTYVPRAGYAAAWDDCYRHHQAQRPGGVLSDDPDTVDRFDD